MPSQVRILLPAPDHYAAIAQLVERIHGKDEVSGSSPDRGSTLYRHSHLSWYFTMAYAIILQRTK